MNLIVSAFLVAHPFLCPEVFPSPAGVASRLVLHLPIKQDAKAYIVSRLIAPGMDREEVWWILGCNCGWAGEGGTTELDYRQYGLLVTLSGRTVEGIFVRPLSRQRPAAVKKGKGRDG
jgi:hypothetical protein